MKKLILPILMLLPFILKAQDESKFGIHFSGYVKNDVFVDTRETESLREGHFYLYPLNIKNDKAGEDVNAKMNFNILSIQTRVSGAITGPDAFGAKTSGLIEGEFFGTQDANTNGFRLRHAYVKLNWKTTELLMGQTWHVFMNPECYPEVINVNTGAPYQPFARNPQVRLTQSLGKFKIALAAMSQRDFTSPGGSLSLRNSAIPEAALRIQYGTKNDANGSEFLIGLAGEYKSLTPRLVSDSNYKTSETVNSLASEFFIKYKTKPLTVKAAAVYGQNLYDLSMIGGYAIKYTTDTAILKKDLRSYTPLNTLAAWVELMTNGSKIQFGLFGGYSKNMGSLQNIQNWTSESSYFGRGRNLAYVYRVSPRVVFISGKTRFALEGDYTSAAYGNKINSLGEVSDIKAVSNIRLLFAAYYFF
ncbi:MAG: hypothetical protein WCM76_13985 [Bacteroidota bacterium]